MSELRWGGFGSAVAVVFYVSLIAMLMNNGERWVGNNKFFGPILFLSLFIVSALVCSLLVFAQPYKLFMEKKGKEALGLVISTTKWLASFVILVILGMMIW